jgi:hypothetical protein
VRPLRSLRPVAAALAVLILAAGCGGKDPNAPSRNLREDDQRWVEGALPGPDVLPEGWSATADDRGAALDDCAALDRSHLTLTGEAVASIELGDDLAAIAGTQIFASEEDARAFVAEPDDGDLVECLEEELAETFSDEEGGTRLEELRFEPAPAPETAETARAADGEGVYAAATGRSPMRLTLVWAQRDRAVLTLVTVGLGEEFPEEIRSALLADFDERTEEKPPP